MKVVFECLRHITEESTIAMINGRFLDFIFEHCPRLKKFECSFYTLRSCSPNVSICLIPDSMNYISGRIFLLQITAWICF